MDGRALREEEERGTRMVSAFERSES